jgi:hypothetical protein
MKKALALVNVVAAVFAATANADTRPTTASPLWAQTPATAYPQAWRDQASRLLATGTNWSKALALRDYVRSLYKVGDGSTCYVYAQTMVALGREFGLPVRVTVASPNALNSYDTHTTVEVWLPEYHKWAIADPTFDEYFTLGWSKVPLGASEIRALWIKHEQGRVKAWESTSSPAKLVDNYIDPRYYFRYLAFYGTIPGYHDTALVYADSAGLVSGMVAVALTDPDRVAPTETFQVEWPAAQWIDAKPHKTDLSYGTPYTGTVAGKAIFVVSSASQNVEGYDLSPSNGGWISPIFTAGAGPYSGKVYLAHTIPAAAVRYVG